MTNLERTVKNQIHEVFVGSYEWSFIAERRKYGKWGPTRVDFDIVSLDGSYVLSIFVRGNLFGLKFTAYYENNDPYNIPHSARWDDYKLQGPQVSKSRKDFIKDNLKAVLLKES